VAEHAELERVPTAAAPDEPEGRPFDLLPVSLAEGQRPPLAEFDHRHLESCPLLRLDGPGGCLALPRSPAVELFSCLDEVALR
jgi:hypothetical protein